MLCQRASLYPAETQEDKHQPTMKRSLGGRSHLDLYQTSRNCLTLLTIYALPDGKWATMHLLVPQPSKVHYPVTSCPIHPHHRSIVYLCQIYSAFFFIRECSSPVPPLSSPFTHSMCTEVERLMESWRGIYLPCLLALSWAVGGQRRDRGWKKRQHQEEKHFTVNLTPFTPFKSPFSSESRVKITLWLRLWSWKKAKKRKKNTITLVLWKCN